MKILVNNSELIFRHANVVEKSSTVAITETGVEGLVSIALDTVAKPNTPIEVTVTGDNGVVADNKWSLKYNAATTNGLIYTNGEKVTIEADVMIDAIWIQRDTTSGTGSITLSVKYVADSQYAPTVVIDEDIVISNSSTSTTVALDSPIVAPCVLQIKVTRERGSYGGFVKFDFLDSSDNVVASGLAATHKGYYKVEIPSNSANVTKVNIGRNTSGNAATGTYASEVIIP